MNVRFVEGVALDSCNRCHLVDGSPLCWLHRDECLTGTIGWFVEDDRPVPSQKYILGEKMGPPPVTLDKTLMGPEGNTDFEPVNYPENPRGSALDVQEGGDHYKRMAIQPVEFCQKNRLHACETSIVKYACRHQDKNGAEDIKKIIHYAQLILEMEYPDEV